MDSWVLWLIAAGVFLLFEMFTITFYSLWLCIGALAGLIVSLIAPEAYVAQVVVACLVALLLTIFTKPISRKLRSSKGFHDTGVELVGREGFVTEPITPSKYGIVKLGGDTWSASSTDYLDKGARVKVIARSSTRVEVEKWEEIE